MHMIFRQKEILRSMYLEPIPRVVAIFAFFFYYYYYLDPDYSLYTVPRDKKAAPLAKREQISGIE